MILQKLLCTVMLIVMIPNIIFGHRHNIRINVDSKYSTLTTTFPYPNNSTFYFGITNHNPQSLVSVRYNISSGGTVSQYKILEGNSSCIPILKSGIRNSYGFINLTFDISNLKRLNEYVAMVFDASASTIGEIEFNYTLETATSVREVLCSKVSETDNWKVTWSVPSAIGADIVQYRLLLVTASGSCPPVLLVQYDVSCRSSSNKHSCYKTEKPVGSAGEKVCPGAQTTESVNCDSTSSNKLFNYIISGSKLRSFIQYKVIIQLGTEWGWSLPGFCKFTTEKTKVVIERKSVRIRSISSSFPDNKLQIVWNPPTTSNKLITQYALLLKTKSSCLIYWNMSCSDCDYQKIGNGGFSIIEPGCLIKSAKTFQKFKISTELTLQSNENIIKPYTDYIMMIQPGNGWGWGNTTYKRFKSGQYKSSRPQVEEILSEFPNNKFQLQWSGPTEPNGVMIEYIVVMETIQNKCVYKWILKATTFTSANAGNNGDVIGKNCDNGRTLTEPDFQSGDVKITVKDNGRSILPYTKYKVSVQGRNGWGYGDILSINTTTGEDKPGPVASFKCNNIDYYGIQCQWKRPTFTNGVINKYVIYCTIIINEHTKYLSVDGNINSINITTGILDNRMYTCIIRAKTRKGYGEATTYIVNIPKSHNLTILPSLTTIVSSVVVVLIIVGVTCSVGCYCYNRFHVNNKKHIRVEQTNEEVENRIGTDFNSQDEDQYEEFGSQTRLCLKNLECGNESRL